MATKQQVNFLKSAESARVYACRLLAAYDEDQAKAADMLSHLDLLHLVEILNLYTHKLEDEYGLGF